MWNMGLQGLTKINHGVRNESYKSRIRPHSKIPYRLEGEKYFIKGNKAVKSAITHINVQEALEYDKIKCSHITSHA